MEYCRELLAVLASVQPGRNYTSAMLHFQAAAAAQALAEKVTLLGMVKLKLMDHPSTSKCLL